MFDLNIILKFSTLESIRINKINSLMEEKGFIYLGKGRHRRTYLSPNKRYVLKFPRNKDGLIANQLEAKTWKEYINRNYDGSNYIAYAACRIIQNSILMMVALSEIYGDTEGDDAARNTGHIGGRDHLYDEHNPMPSWAEDIDAFQVGKLANGKLVAYDYAEY